MDHDAKLEEFHLLWMAAKAEREALETACLEEFFGNGLEFLLESNLGLYKKMKDYLHTFVFDHDVPEVGEPLEVPNQ